MTLSMYAVSVPLFRHRLRALSGVLEKAEAFASAQGRDPAALLAAKLAPDMLPLTRQVQIACDQAKGGTARLAGIEAPKFDDTETSFAELRARIARTLAFVESVPRDAIDGSETRDIVLRFPQREFRFTGVQFLLGWAIPHLLFHCTTAYGILRHEGVPLGKSDFIGGG